MENEQFKLNAFLVGAQKSATTSLYYWISQHPDICAPISMKDFPYFAKDEFFEKGDSYLRQEYEKCNESSSSTTFVQGSVSYMFYPYSIQRIFDYNPASKLILVLRNPIDRAVSAYRYFVKMQKETETFEKAIEQEDERMQSPDFAVRSDLAYLNHGLYGKQLQEIYEVFPKNQVLVLLYDELKNNPLLLTKRVFEFLEVDEGFVPEFIIKNQTGTVRSQRIQKAFFGESGLRKFLVSCINPVFPLHQRTRLRLKLREWNTNAVIETNTEVDVHIRSRLQTFFNEDINLLEELTGFNLESWKG